MLATAAPSRRQRRAGSGRVLGAAVRGRDVWPQSSLQGAWQGSAGDISLRSPASAVGRLGCFDGRGRVTGPHPSLKNKRRSHGSSQAGARPRPSAEETSRGSALRAGRLVGSHCDSGHRAPLSTQDERHGSQGEAGPSREGGDLCDVLGRGCWAPIPAGPRERGARLSPPPPMPGVVAAKALSAAHGAPRSLPLHAGRLGAVWCLLTNLVTGLVKCGRNTAPVTGSPPPPPPHPSG